MAGRVHGEAMPPVMAPHKARPRRAFRCESCGRWIRLAFLGMCQQPEACYHCGAWISPGRLDSVLATHGAQAVHLIAEWGVVVRLPAPRPPPGEPDRGFLRDRGIAHRRSGQAWDVPEWMRPALASATQAAAKALEVEERRMDGFSILEWGWSRWVPVRPDQVEAMGFSRRMEPALAHTPGAWWGIYWSHY